MHTNEEKKWGRRSKPDAAAMPALCDQTFIIDLILCLRQIGCQAVLETSTVILPKKV